MSQAGLLTGGSGGGGSGDVNGPGSSTVGDIVTWNNTAGTAIADSGVAFPINVANGGTGQTTLTNHGVLVGAGTTAITQLAAGTANQVLQSGGASANPAYSTATYPATTTANQILYSSATNTITGLATANNGTLITSASGVPSLLANGTTGQVLTATTGSPPSWAAASSGGIIWTAITASQTLAVNNGYVCIASGGALSLALPATAAVGSTFTVSLDGATSWTITQGSGQKIRFGNVQTTSGAGGSLASTAQGDTVTFICSVANNNFNVISSMGNITVV